MARACDWRRGGDSGVGVVAIGTKTGDGTEEIGAVCGWLEELMTMLDKACVKLDVAEIGLGSAMVVGSGVT